MSRTRRTKRPQMRLGSLLQHKDGTVPDGTPTHSAKSCRHYGGCPCCLRDRTHANKRRMMKDGEE